MRFSSALNAGLQQRDPLQTVLKSDGSEECWWGLWLSSAGCYSMRTFSASCRRGRMALNVCRSAFALPCSLFAPGNGKSCSSVDRQLCAPGVTGLCSCGLSCLVSSVYSIPLQRVVYQSYFMVCGELVPFSPTLNIANKLMNSVAKVFLLHGLKCASACGVGCQIQQSTGAQSMWWFLHGLSLSGRVLVLARPCSCMQGAESVSARHKSCKCAVPVLSHSAPQRTIFWPERSGRCT